MKSRAPRIVVLVILILFVLNFSFLQSIQSFFSLALPTEESSMPQAIPKLNVDSFGKSSFSFPISVPPGSGDTVPKLSILYNSASSAGILGKGFSLEGLPTVQVNPNFGYFENGSRFISSIGGELLSDSSGSFFSKFQPSLKISRLSGGAWKFEEKNGTVYLFGTSIDSKIFAQAPDSGRVISWGLKSVRDSFGNGYDVSYDSDGLSKGLLLPSEIVYVHGNARISFGYSNEASGFSSILFFSNVKQYHSKVLSSIDVFARDEFGSESNVDSYSFDYIYDDTSRLLKTIRRSNFDPLTFSYTDHSDVSLSSPSFNRSISNGFALTFRAIQEGLQGAFDNGVIACACTSNAGCMASVGPWAILICGWATQNIWDVHSNGVETSFAGALDVTGDGIAEYVRVLGSKDNQHFYVTDLQSAGDALNSSLPIDSSPLGNVLNLTSRGRIFPGDFNGDGKADFLLFEKPGVPFRIFWGPDFHDSGTNVTAFVPQSQDKRGRHFIADMNGDGLSDLVQANVSLGLDVFLSDGSSLNFAQTLSFSDFGLEFQLFADLDRNGIPDFVRMEGLPGSRRLIVSFLSLDPISNSLSVVGSTSLNESSSFGGSFGSSGNRFFADTNGDGFLDFVSMSSGSFPFFGTFIHQYHFNGKDFQSENIGQFVNDVPLSSEIGNPFLPGAYGYADYDINYDGRMDRVTRNGETGYLVEILKSDGSFSSPISVMPNQDTMVDLDEDGQDDKIRVGYFFFIVQIQVRFAPNDRLVWNDIDNNRMAIPTPTPEETASLSDLGYSNWKNKIDFSDLNRDGKADLVFFQNGRINVRLAGLSSSGSVSFPLTSDFSWASGGFLQSLDFNGDGVTELIGVSSSPQKYSDWTPSPNPALPSILVRQVPFASNSTLEVLRFEPKIPDGLIQNIYQGTESSFLQVTKIEYDLKKSHLASQPASQRINASAVAPAKPNVFPFLAPESVVKSISSFGWDGSAEFLISKTDFTFSTPRFFRGPLRKSSLLGYESVSSFDSISGTDTVRFFSSSDPDLAGVETSLSVSKAGVPIHSSSYVYSKSVFPNGSVWIRPVSSSEAIFRSGVLLQSVNTSLLYDANFNQTGKSSTIDGVTVSDLTSFDSASFLLKPQFNESLKGGQVIARKEFDFSGNSISRVREKLDGSVFSESQFLSFDSFGNPTQVRDARGNVSTIEYDSVVHKFPIRITNSFGHVSEKTFDLRRGLELSSKDANGNITETKYDSFGRVVAVKAPGSSDWTKTIEYSNSGSLVNARAKTTVYADADSVSWSEEIVNLKEGLTVKRGSLLDGLVLTEATYKDQAGKVLRKIEPYLEGQEILCVKDYFYDDNQDLIKIVSNEGTETSISYNGNTTTTVSKSGSTILSTSVEVKNGFGQTISKTTNGKTIGYEYTPKGNVSKIIDPENGQTSIGYNFAGMQTSLNNVNSGSISYDYDSSGNLIEERHANGSRIVFTYDSLGRILSKRADSSSGTSVHSYEYDLPSSPNGVGRLSKVTDELGTTEFAYDSRGNQTVIKKTIFREDNLVLLVEKKFNFLNQVTEVVYPEGTKINHKYSQSGYLNGITLTPGDGSAGEHPLVSYRGPVIEGNRVKIIRELGNGVWTDIYVDKLTKRALETVTKIGTNVYENVAYSYDEKGNFSQIEDKLNGSRTQNFTYDSSNRLVSATGKYGTEDYIYSDTGKLLKKGDRTFSYGDAAHANAVTHVSSAGYIGDYAYDGSGNMISRNGSTLVYDGFQKLRRMDTVEQGTIEYEYDFSGSRVIKNRLQDASKVISLGGMYEISYRSGFSPQHTLYFKGAGGELIGQWTTETAVLRTSTASNGWNQIKNDTIGKMNGIYYKSVHQIFETREFLRTNPFGVFSGIVILLALGICFVLLHKGELREGIQLKLLTPLTLISMLMFVTNCNGLLNGGSGDDPPWMLAPLVIPPGTPAIFTTPSQSGNSGIPIGGTPVNGFVFFNTDHLGSVTMAMDGQGNRLGGGEWGGSSHVSYKPYGEVQRNDSQGPDIFRYKYTGQEEDRETGLYYYKARYYDPEIGRFTQADSILDTKNPNSMDLYMYTEGNPVNHTDPSGNSIGLGAIAAITFPMFSLPTIGAAAVGVAIMASVVIASALAAIGLGTSLGYMGLNGAPVVAGAVGIAALSTLNSALYLIASGAGVTFAYASGAATFVGIAAAMGIGFIGSVAYMIVSPALGGGLVGLGVSAVALASATTAAFMLGATALATTVAIGLGAATIVAFSPFTAIGSLAVAGAVGVLAILAAVSFGFVLVVSALTTAAFAIGSVLNQNTAQAYLAGGYSKSSWNNIHWDEKAARKWACYMSAGQMAAMAAAGAIYGAPALGVGTASSVLQAPLFGSIVNVQKLLIVKSSIDFVVNASHGEYANAAIAAADIFSPVPIGLTVKAAKGVERTCEGNL